MVRSLCLLILFITFFWGLYVETFVGLRSLIGTLSPALHNAKFFFGGVGPKRGGVFLLKWLSDFWPSFTNSSISSKDFQSTSTELVTSELDFLKDFHFTSTELVTIREMGFHNGFWKHQNWISSKERISISQVQNW